MPAEKWPLVVRTAGDRRLKTPADAGHRVARVVRVPIGCGAAANALAGAESAVAATRTDFLVGPERVALAVKLAGPESQLARELAEDVDHYEGQSDCGGLVVLIYDAEQSLHDRPLGEVRVVADRGVQMLAKVRSQTQQVGLAADVSHLRAAGEPLWVRMPVKLLRAPLMKMSYQPSNSRAGTVTSW